jgi:type II secretory ATPase GspE/PulE/Tfp pilus assembly ATPase PilB-like protein
LTGKDLASNVGLRAGPRGCWVAFETYLAMCWNCLGEFDALHAVWCSDDPKNPTKLCPFCFRCFCEATDAYKQEFWRRAPTRLKEELNTLHKSRDRLGDILIRLRKLTTPQLLDALVEQKNTGQRLGEILIQRGFVSGEDIEIALRTQGVNPLTDTMGVAFASSPVWEQSGPEGIIDYILNLAARKGASDVQLEPKEDCVSVKYRIDGFTFRLDPIPKRFQAGVAQKIFETFRLDSAREARPQKSRITTRVADGDYDLVAQTLPTTYGISATIKLVNRATFIKDFPTLGLELEERVRLMEELRGSFGMVLLSAPVYHGVKTTAYSVLNFLVRGEREVMSLEQPVQWRIEGARQVEVEPDQNPSRMEETLRSVVAVRPEVLMLASLPDRGTALLASQLASSLLVLAVVNAPSAAQAVTSCLQLGVTGSALSTVLGGVTCQRLVRQICTVCRQPAEPPPAQTLAARGLGGAGPMQFFRGAGCPTCNRTGYHGRRAIFELLTGTPEVRAGIRQGLPAAELEELAAAGGMTRLRERCLKLVGEGVTTFDEMVRLRL